MDTRRQKQLPIACRYVPYDQWFLTHSNPAWKIKHLKQRILAKSLSLPFDHRHIIQRTTPDDRAPSPITFAPDEGQRPVSPIEFAKPLEVRKKRSGQPGTSESEEQHDEDGGEGGSGVAAAAEEGYEEDDEWDDDDDDFDDFDAAAQQPMGGRVDLPSSSNPPVPRPIFKQQQNSAAGSTPTSSRRKAFSPLAKIAKSVTGAGSGSADHQSSQPPAPSQESADGDQIDTQFFTLVRFSTGQILEDDFLVTWYDLCPHELVELHASCPPLNFAVSVNLCAILTHSLATVNDSDDRKEKGKKNAKHSHSKSGLLLIDTSLVNATSSASPSALAAALTPNALVPHAQQLLALSAQVNNLKKSQSTSSTAQYFYTSRRELTSLPRTDLTKYIQPYWEGWVRALRVVWRSNTDLYQHHQIEHPYGQSKYGYSEYATMSGVGGGGVAMAQWEPAMYMFGEPSAGAVDGHPDRDAVREVSRANERSSRGVGAGDYHRADYERYGLSDQGVAGQIHGRTGYGHGYRTGYPGDGRVHGTRDKAKEKEKTTGAQARPKTTLEWRERWVVVRDGIIWLHKNREDPTPTHQLQLSGLIALRDAEHLANSVHSKRKERERERAREGQAGTRHHGRSLSRARESDRKHQPQPQPHRQQRRRSTSPPRASPSTARDPKSVHRTVRTGEAGQQDDTERQKAAVKESERRRLKEKHDREIEALRRWDDIGISFKFGKGKEKEKEKDRVVAGKSGREKEKEDTSAREHDARRMDSMDRPKDREKEKERERMRAREKDNEREKERRNYEREQAQKDPRTFIPSSRDEADAAGMKIVCAKFRSVKNSSKSRPTRIHDTERNDGNQVRYTSTGPSLAGDLTGQIDSDVHELSGRRGIREERIEHGRHKPVYGHVMNAPPRKSSLPGLGIGLGKLGVSSNSSAAVLAPSQKASNLESVDTPGPVPSGSGATKFGIGGLFGRDKESEDDLGGRREKEEKKRAEKERKAREKEQKQLEKERKKDKDKQLPTRPTTDHSQKSMGVSTVRALEPATQRITASSASLSTADSSTLRPERSRIDISDENAFASNFELAPLPRPPATDPDVSADATAGEDGVEGSDSDSSSLSLSSPVFAHSTDEGESDSADDFGSTFPGRDRRGYRHGGYQPPLGKKIGTQSNVDIDSRSEAGQSQSGRETTEGRENVRENYENLATADNKRRRRVEDTAKMRRPGRSDPEERGEWLVLDLGSDSAFNSLLRIFHRHFPPPLSSTFIPASLTSSAPPVTPLHTNSQPHDPSSTFVMQPDHLPAATSNHHQGDDAPLAPKDDPSAMSVAVVTSSSDEDGNQLNEAPSVDAHDPQTSRPIHPNILASLAISSNQNAVVTPALPYPEWRIEIVHRARFLGMREAGRPLAFALNGWGRGFDELKELVGDYSRRRRKDELWERRTRTSFIDSLILGGRTNLLSDAAGLQSQSSTDAWLYSDVVAESSDTAEEPDGRRMSLVSHVSTIKAPVASIQDRRDVIARSDVAVNDDDDDDDDDKQSTSAEMDQEDAQLASEGTGVEDMDMEDISGRMDDEYEGGYAYGKDDEDDALAEGLGSFMEDSEEESETEWLAWITDLPRQSAVQQQRDEIEQQRREKGRRDQPESDELLQPLSPMMFSNPFTGAPSNDAASFMSQDVLLPPLPPPKTPEEERMLFAQKRRKLEPSATSVSATTPSLSHGGVLHHAASSTSSISHLHARTPSRSISSASLTGSHTQRFSNPATLSSPSSSESLGAYRSSSRVLGRVTPIGVNTANVSTSKVHSAPMSPLGATFSPIVDPDVRDLPPPQSSGNSYSRPMHQRAHSRSISGSGSGIFSPTRMQARVLEDEEDWDGQHFNQSPTLRPNSLHHSASMPLTRSIPVGVNTSVTSRPSTSTLAQVEQIEAESEEYLVSDRISAFIQSNSPPTTSPLASPQLTTREHSYHSLPRRLSASSSASPNFTGNGNFGRSASTLAKPSQSPTSTDKATAERGVLKKRRSDLSHQGGASLFQQGSLASGSSNIDSTFTTAHPQNYGLTPGTTVKFIKKGSTGSGSVATLQTAKSLLRRVRSGSSLNHDAHAEEPFSSTEYQQPPWSNNDSETIPENDVADGASNGKARESSPVDAQREPPPIQTKKKKGPMDRLVRGLDSALDFVEGR